MKTAGRERIILVILVVLFLILILPYMVNIYYVLPASDDFTQYSPTIDTLKGSLQKANDMYMSWNGYWVYNIIYSFFHPLKFFRPGSHLIGLQMNLQFLLFVIFTSLVICVLTGRFMKGRNFRVGLFFAFLAMAMILNSRIFEETFGWYVGSKYVGAVILEAQCILLAMKYTKKRGWLSGILLSVIGFTACEVVNVAVIIGAAYLFLLYVKYKKEKPLKKDIITDLIPLVFCVAGGLVYAFSPGNYIRKSTVDPNGINPFTGLVDSAVDLAIYTADLFTNYIVTFGLLLSFLAAIWLVRKGIFSGKYFHPLLPFILTFAANYLLIFPAATGYASIELPTRIIYILYSNMIPCLMLSFMNLGVFVQSVYGEKISNRELLYGLIAFVLGLYCAAGNRAYISQTPYAKQILDHGKVVKFNEDWTDIFNEIAASEDEDVVVDGEGKTLFVEILEPPYIINDPKFSVNSGAAAFFNKKSVAVINWVEK